MLPSSFGRVLKSGSLVFVGGSLSSSSSSGGVLSSGECDWACFESSSVLVASSAWVRVRVDVGAELSLTLRVSGCRSVDIATDDARLLEPGNESEPETEA